MAKLRSKSTTRRKFLAAVAGSGAVLAMPQVSRAQTVTLKMQSGLGATDILNDYGQRLCRQGQRDGRRPAEDRLPQSPARW